MLSSHVRLNSRQVLVRLAIAALVWFGGGVVVSRVLGMAFIDSVAFLMCQGVVFLLGAVFFAAVYGPQEDSEEGS